jgi:peptidoglycan biosynthesis protein MviN/MurJ (putative lipid II flippase)
MTRAAKNRILLPIVVFNFAVIIYQFAFNHGDRSSVLGLGVAITIGVLAAIVTVVVLKARKP